MAPSTTRGLWPLALALWLSGTPGTPPAEGAKAVRDTAPAAASPGDQRAGEGGTEACRPAPTPRRRREG